MRRAATALATCAAVAALLSGCASTGGGDLLAASALQRQAQERLQVAALHYDAGREEVALFEANQAVALDPGLAQAYALLARIHAGRGQVSQADRHFQFALRLSPHDPELANQYGVFLCNARARPRQARRQFDAAIANSGNVSPIGALVNGGMCSLRHGDLAAAERYLVLAARLEPGLPEINAGLAHIHFERRDIARAAYFMNRLFETQAFGAMSADALWLAIRVERGLGDQDRQAQLAGALRRAHPYSPVLSAFERGVFDE